MINSGFLLLLGIIIVVVVAIRFVQLAQRLQALERQLDVQSLEIQDLSRKFIQIQNQPLAKPIVEKPTVDMDIQTIRQSLQIIEPKPVKPEPAEQKVNLFPETPAKQIRQESNIEQENNSGLFFFEKIRNSAEIESLIGGNILNRIGAFALILGIGFFLKYAFDNDLIPPVLRVIIGASVGFALIGTGIRANAKKFEIFAQGLFGAGISALYLSVYASFNFYQLVPQSIAFILMSCVTAVALVVAVHYNSLAIALLGWAGGFLTPFLLASNEPNVVGLFVYLALLNLGMLAIVFIKSEWIIVETLSLFGTHLIYAIWYYGNATEKPIGILAFFLTVIWLLFLASEAYQTFQNIKTFLPQRFLVSAFNAIFYFSFLYAAIMPSPFFFLIPIAIATTYLALFFLIQNHNRDTDSALLSSYLIGAIAFLTAAIEVAFDDFLTVTLWALLALLVLWLSIKMRKIFLEGTSLVLFCITLFRLFISPDIFTTKIIEDFTPVLNLRVLAVLVFAISLATSAFWLRKEEKTALSLTLDCVWSFLVFMLLTVEVNDIFLKRQYALNEKIDISSTIRSMSFGIAWLFYAMPLIWFGIRQSLKSLTLVGLAILVLGIFWNILFGFAYNPIAYFIPVLNLRAFSFLIIIAGIWLQLKWLRESGEGESYFLIFLQYAFTVLLFLLITTEGIDYFRKVNADNSPSNTGGYFYRALTLATLWTLYAIPMIYFGLKKEIKPLFVAGIFSFTIAVWFAVVSGFVYDPIENFTLVLNYRSGVYALLILGGAFLAVTFKETASPRFVAGFGITAALLGTIFLTAECNRLVAQLR